MSTDRPDDPRDADWPKATGPDGDVWVNQEDDGSWTICSPSGGFDSVDANDFEDDYEFDVGHSTLDDQPDG